MNRIHTTLLILLTLYCCTSCQEYSYIENELHGLWQVTSVEDKTTNMITQAQGELYYSFQRNMVIVGYNSPSKPTGMMMTQYTSNFFLNGDTIEINDFRIYQEYETKAPLQALKKFGIHGEHTIFTIERPKKSALILDSDKARVVLRKY